ncbi:MAG: hypothetical protein WC758_05880 [Candidatus Woesearchaeota archaeon]|jgi:hypothetical protein
MEKNVNLQYVDINVPINNEGNVSNNLLDSRMFASTKAVVGTIQGMNLEVMMEDVNIFAQAYKLKIVDVPKFANLIRNLPSQEVQNLRSDVIFFNSSEYLVLDSKQNTLYLTAHSEGPFTSPNVANYLIHAAAERNGKINLAEFEKNITKNSVQEIYFEDLLHNFEYTKKPEQFTVYADIHNHELLFHNKPFLSHSEWMVDEVILMRCGGKEERELIGDLLFKKEGNVLVRNGVLPINSFDKSWGGIMALGPKDYGLFSSINKTQGRMVVSDEILLAPTLDMDLEKYIYKEHRKDYAGK